MIRVIKLLAISSLLFAMACEPSGEYEEAEIDNIQSDADMGSAEQFPIIVLDRISAISQLGECENGMPNYLCGIIEEIAEHASESPIFVRPRRPRHCPQLNCGQEEIYALGAPKGGGTPGTICEPDRCRSVFEEACFDGLENMKFEVKAAHPEFVAAGLYAGEELISSTDEEFGGSVIEGANCNSAILNFGVPAYKVGEPGVMLRVRTVVEIDGELIETSFEVAL